MHSLHAQPLELASVLMRFVPLQATIQPPADPYALPAPSGHLPKSITVYQYEVCPFCCKVKTFLDYHKVSKQ